jgi:hypothetical protein
MPTMTELSLPCGFVIDVRSNIRAERPNVILSSGYGIFGFGEPVQTALVSRLEKLGIGWAQYTYVERNSKNDITDLLISSGTAALLRVYDWVSLQYPSKIGLFGISFGANVTLEAALQRDPALLLLVNPVVDYVDYRERQLGSDVMTRWKRDSVISLTYDGAEVISYYRFMEESRSQRLLTRVSSISAEIIACQGAADTILTTKYVEALSVVLSKFRFTVIDGADHVFASAGAIAGFLEAIDGGLRDWV